MHISWSTIILFLVFGCLPLAFYNATGVKGVVNNHALLNLLWLIPTTVLFTYLSEFHPVVFTSLMTSIIIVIYGGSTALLASSMFSTGLLMALPTETTFLSSLLGLEFASVLSTSIALYVFRAKRANRQLTDLFYPLLVYNFITYIILIIGALIFINNPGTAEEETRALTLLVSIYAILKFTITPVFLAKTPFYNYLSLDTLCAIILPTVLVGLPALLFIPMSLIAAYPIISTVISVMIVLFVAYNLLKLWDERQLFMYSTPLYTLPLLLLWL